MDEDITIPDMNIIKPILPRRMKVECSVLLGFYQHGEGQ